MCEPIVDEPISPKSDNEASRVYRRSWTVIASAPSSAGRHSLAGGDSNETINFYDRRYNAGRLNSFAAVSMVGSVVDLPAAIYVASSVVALPKAPGTVAPRSALKRGHHVA